MYGTILTSWSYLLWYSVSHYFIPTASTVYSKNIPPIPLHPSVSPLNACVFDGNPFMDLMDFSGLFSRIWEMFSKKEKGESWPAQTLLPRVWWTAEDSISVCIKRMRNFQLTKQGGQVNMDLRAGWLQSHVKKKTGQNVVVKLLPTYSEVKLGGRLESRKKGRK